MKRNHLELLKRISSCPTAPGKESVVAAAVEKWAARRDAVDIARDRAGNLVLHYRRGRPRRQWVYAAHMDHPGFIVTAPSGKRTVTAEFRGGVRKEFFVGRRVRVFAPGGEAVGTIRSVRSRDDRGYRPCRIVLDKAADVPAGALGMWDVPVFDIHDGRLTARACDDVVGVAAAVCALDEIIVRKIAADITLLLTRAEEVGFIGALAACQAKTMPSDALVVGLETSKAQPFAPLGGGVVIRVGDRMSIFDSELTDHISSVAAAIAKRTKTFAYERRVMPGGTCESTVYCAFGYRAAGLALPLGNYHNMGDDGEIAPEQIDLADFASCVKLLTALVAEPAGPAETAAKRRRALRDRLKKGRSILAE